MEIIFISPKKMLLKLECIHAPITREWQEGTMYQRVVRSFIAGLNNRGMDRGAEGRYNLKAEVGKAWVHGKDSGGDMMRVLELFMVIVTDEFLRFTRDIFQY